MQTSEHAHLIAGLRSVFESHGFQTKLELQLEPRKNRGHGLWAKQDWLESLALGTCWWSPQMLQNGRLLKVY